ncbi:MAG: 2-C-methyl-D-erythritol 2,4-cyclodiphosphate synthase, partial [Rhizomicrobium sp.]
QETVRLGLEALAASSPDIVLIHDAARPLVPQAVIDGVIDALKSHDAAVPLLPVADTLRKQVSGKWVTVPRDGLLRAQTPQGFHFDKILAAHRRFADTEVTDDMALAELAGLEVVAVDGDEINMKVTQPKDFIVAENLLAGKEMPEYRTGTGYDVHKFTDGNQVWLCGVSVPHTEGLLGHSDADVALHALTDAVLGAISDGDIGSHFPPTDERWRGAPSWKFLDYANERVKAKGGAIVHCDVTIICERPKVGPHREAMRARLAEILHIDIDRVSVKGTTTEGLGFTGRREGIAAIASATVRL